MSEGGRNPDWTADENKTLVDVYFEVFNDQLAGRRRKPEEIRQILLARGVDRGRGSIDFKLGNTSSVLSRLGLPWLRGFSPAPHLQRALSDEVEQRLPPALIYAIDHDEISPEPFGLSHTTKLFVDVPTLKQKPDLVPEAFVRLARKFDPAARDDRNRKLGEAGEKFVLEVEKRRLVSLGLDRRIKDLRWVAKEDGDGLGYDIRSFDDTGRQERLIEVKTTRGGALTPFFLTENERHVAEDRREHWQLYRVHAFANTPKIYTVSPPLGETFKLETSVWKVRPGGKPTETTTADVQ
ncbi:hypothetical protein LCGC14_0801390 [marine sediment metagenome]|uniref:Protein NO VEIN C-terminal domain-containing protein n=1 Tax=marine sediment metagenome TaxID=412755 RepID=A0A0F9SWM1_9ZZZZ